MPTLTQFGPGSQKVPSIPMPNGANTVDVLNAIRTYLITTANQDAGRADLQGNPTQQNPMPAPSQFTVTKVLYRNVVFTSADGTQKITVPVLVSLQLTNTVSGQTWLFAAPPAATAGGTVGAAL